MSKLDKLQIKKEKRRAVILTADKMSNVTNFSRKAKNLRKDTKARKDIFCKMPALPQARDCIKIIKSF